MASLLTVCELKFTFYVRSQQQPSRQTQKNPVALWTPRDQSILYQVDAPPPFKL